MFTVLFLTCKCSAWRPRQQAYVVSLVFEDCPCIRGKGRQHSCTYIHIYLCLHIVSKILSRRRKGEHKAQPQSRHCTHQVGKVANSWNNDRKRMKSARASERKESKNSQSHCPEFCTMPRVKKTGTAQATICTLSNRTKPG